MPIEQVKLAVKKLKCPVPATLTVQRGKIGLYRGKFARVEIWTSKAKPLCLCRKIGNEVKRQFFGLNEITLANDTARRYEMQGRASGENFGTISDDERRALMAWREFSRAAGTKSPARPLSEIVSEAIEREAHKDETPFFKDVAFQFLDNKDKTRNLTLDYRTRMRNRLKTLSSVFDGVRIGKITVDRLNDAISRVARPRGGNAPAEKTRKHWQALAKEVFEWFYKRENATRRASERLTNPLENLELQRITHKKDPQTLPLAQVRALLCDLLEHAPEAVPAAVAQLFCGLRNAEALRVRWRDIRDGEIILSRNYTKTRIARSVPVPNVAQAWFDAAKLAGTNASPDALLYPKNDTSPAALAAMSAAARKLKEETDFTLRQKKFAGAMNRACARVGIAKPENAFRHTAVSMMCKIYGFAKAADYCGHSIKQQGDAYRNAVSAQVAKDYFGIMPPVGDGKAIAFRRDARATDAVSRAENAAGSASDAQDEQEAARRVPARATPAASA